MNLDKEVFTTFEAARICNANVSSIKNWIEQGELSAFRTPGGHYRIERQVLQDFLDRHAMPNPFLDHQTSRILLALTDGQLSSEVGDSLSALENTDVYVAKDATDALLRMGYVKADILIADGDFGLDITALPSSLAEYSELDGVQIVCLKDEEGDPVDGISFLQNGNSRDDTLEAIMSLVDRYLNGDEDS